MPMKPRLWPGGESIHLNYIPSHHMRLPFETLVVSANILPLTVSGGYICARGELVEPGASKECVVIN